MINLPKLKTKTFQIDWDGKKEDVTIREFTFGEFNELIQAATKIGGTPSAPKVDLDQRAMKEQALLKSIQKAPFEITLKTIQELPNTIGQKIYREIDELNSLPPQEKKT